MRADTTEFTLERALWCARFAKAAYMDDRGELMRYVTSFDPAFVNVETFREASSQGAVIVHPRYVVAAFRGTDELADWLGNIDTTGIPTELGAQHGGFTRALQRIWPRMYESVRRRRREVDTRLPLWITGHSLGGAMATLCAANMVARDDPFYGCYTFGAPRCGDRQFARNFNVEAGRRTFRFCNNNDLVTRVPARLMGYSHVGTLRYITEWGDIEEDPSWWFRFLDGVRGAVADLGELGLDGVKDHGIDTYIGALECAQ